MAWSIILVCGAKLSQQWSGACFSYTLESGELHPSGSLDKCFGTPDGKWGLSLGNLSMGGPALQTQLFWSCVQIC